MTKREIARLSFAAFIGIALAVAATLRDFDPKPSNVTISVTNDFFGVATFTVTGTATSAKRLAAAINCVRGEIPWNLPAIRRLTEDKVQQIRALEAKVQSYEKNQTKHSGVVIDEGISNVAGQ